MQFPTISAATLFLFASNVLADSCTYHQHNGIRSYGFNMDVVHTINGQGCTDSINAFENCLSSKSCGSSSQMWNCKQFYDGKGFSGSFNAPTFCTPYSVSTCLHDDWGVTVNCKQN